jgi:putative sterol carrier protein
MPDEVSSLGFGPFAKLKPLARIEHQQTAASFDQMAKSLHGATFSGVARFVLVDDTGSESFTVAIERGTAKVVTEAKKIDFEIITSPETWLDIAAGKLAPLDAFTRGQMRVRGNHTLGQRIMKKLAADAGRLEFC